MLACRRLLRPAAGGQRGPAKGMSTLTCHRRRFLNHSGIWLGSSLARGITRSYLQAAEQRILYASYQHTCTCIRSVLAVLRLNHRPTARTNCVAEVAKAASDKTRWAKNCQIRFCSLCLCVGYPPCLWTAVLVQSEEKAALDPFAHPLFHLQSAMAPRKMQRAHDTNSFRMTNYGNLAPQHAFKKNAFREFIQHGLRSFYVEDLVEREVDITPGIESMSGSRQHLARLELMSHRVLESPCRRAN